MSGMSLLRNSVEITKCKWEPKVRVLNDAAHWHQPLGHAVVQRKAERGSWDREGSKEY